MGFKNFMQFFSHLVGYSCVFVFLDTTSDFTEQYMADARTHIRKNGVSGIEEFLKKKLEQSKNSKIRFGITGDSGAGKSAFINAVRG